MTLEFGERWGQNGKRLTAACDEKRARKCHEKRKMYAALVSEKSTPKCVIEINNDYVGVNFLDELKRIYLSYSFRELAPGRVFLEDASYYEFQGSSENVATLSTYLFHQDGRVEITIDKYSKKERLTKETTADVSKNWEQYPEFGKYEAFLREER